MSNREVGHYQGAIEPIDFILKNKLGYCEGNVIKYVYRHGQKNGADDIVKAIDYLRLLVKQSYPECYSRVCTEAAHMFGNGE